MVSPGPQPKALMLRGKARACPMTHYRPLVDGHEIRTPSLSYGTCFTAGGFQVPSMMEDLGGSTGQ
jgi:hypothetical protein